MQRSTMYRSVNDTVQLRQATDASAPTVVTSRRNADVTWRAVRTPLFFLLSSGGEAHRSIRFFLEQQLGRAAAQTSSQAAREPTRGQTRLWAPGREAGGVDGRGCLAPLVGNVKAARGRWLWSCVAEYRLPSIWQRALTFISQRRRRRTCLTALWRGWDGLRASCGLKGYGLPPPEVLLVGLEIGIHLEKPAECRNWNMILRVCHRVFPSDRTSRAPSRCLMHRFRFWDKMSGRVLPRGFFFKSLQITRVRRPPAGGVLLRHGLFCTGHSLERGDCVQCNFKMTRKEEASGASGRSNGTFLVALQRTVEWFRSFL